VAQNPLLHVSGYTFDERRHAVAILGSDYPEVCEDLVHVLEPLEIPHEQIIAGGGGKAPMTQALERSLRNRGWDKKVFRMQQTIDESVIDSTTHEIDHFRGFRDGRPGIALEIEWNNKDPFYDRDLETFARLHRLGVISVGVLITRGPTMQDALREAFIRYYSRLTDEALREVIAALQGQARVRVERATSMIEQARAIAIMRFQSKYGEATTHWRKLMVRIDRGLGNPCPLLLIGIEGTRLRP
jgi:hypothetical protein